MSSTSQSIVGLQDTDDHIRRRLPWARGLSPSALKDYEEAVAVRAKQLINRLEEQQGPVALDRWIDYFAYVLCSCCECYVVLKVQRYSYDFMSDMA